VFRGSPLLIQLFLIYYGLGQFGVIRHSFLWPLLREPFICAVLALALCTAAYTAEILRGALLAVPPGRLKPDRPAGCPVFAAATHHRPGDAALCAAGLLDRGDFAGEIHGAGQPGDGVDVTGVAQQIIQRTYRTMEVFLCAAVIYLLLNFIIVQLYALLERRLTPHTRQTPATVSLKPAAKGE
jgi:octopine/nopaline transport system permease protein